MSQIETPEFLVGTSVYLGVHVLGEDGNGYDLTFTTVTAEVRGEAGRRQAVMDIEWIERSQGRYVLWAPGDRTCAGWAPGDYTVRVVYSEAGGAFGGQPLVVGTERVRIKVVE